MALNPKTMFMGNNIVGKFEIFALASAMLLLLNNF
jgi:hypothetical protein